MTDYELALAVVKRRWDIELRLRDECYEMVSPDVSQFVYSAILLEDLYRRLENIPRQNTDWNQ